ncbi:MAG: SusC/RagA family protein [Bacteroidetes bacterium]|nr:SusC/RagA family protein [Bacteroidota bacterium]MBP1677681.1 SusC/RagA family protein [Bacteroidota bacterium]
MQILFSRKLLLFKTDMLRKFETLLLLLLINIGVTMAQTYVKGTVTAEDNGEMLIGATVKIEGENVGVITDVNGHFELSVPKGKNIVVSYVSMESQVLLPKPLMNIVLKSNTTLKEVVVTGMQQMDKRLFTGATSKVSGANAKLDGVADVSRSLEGKVAGVSVQNVSGTFGTAPKIRVRGATSIYGNSKPLWVVDGVIMEDVTEVSADELSSGDAVTLISSAIAGLNSDDIESFQILKDGSATSIYGARAMAGVIVVTTKKGRAGSNKISFTSELSLRLKPSYDDFNIMNSQEQMAVYKEMNNAGLLNFAETYRAANSGVYGKMYHLLNTYDPSTGAFALANTQSARNAYLREAEYRNTDWFDLLFSNSITQNHSISMASGTEKAQYYTSFSYMNDPGWYKQSNVQRYTGNVNALYQISKKLKLNIIGNAAYRKQRAPGTLGQSLDVVSGEVKRDFDINPFSYALNSSRALDPDAYYVRNYAAFNIFNELENNFMNFNVVDTKIQTELKYKPTAKLELSTIYAYKFSTTLQEHEIHESSNQALAYRSMDDATIRDSNPWLYTDPDNANSLPVSVLSSGGFYRETKYRMNSWDVRATANYNDVFNEDHIVNFFGGMEVNSLERRKTFFQGVGMQYDMGLLASFDYQYFKQSQEEGTSYYSVVDANSRSAAFFGTANYSYQGKYSINGTMRYEGTNKLGRSRSARWLPTWNISGAWNAHEEKWFGQLRPVMSNFTLRASYSLTADRGPSFVTNSLSVISSYNPWRPFTSATESGLQLEDIENSELTYEKKHELNIGAATGFLNNRINIELDWYRRNNFDLIGIVNTTGVGGIISKYANVASMRSHGVEFSISTKNIEAKNFKWSTDFIFSRTKNTVTDFDSNTSVIEMVTGNGFTMEGYPVRSLFSFDFRGLNEDGVPTFVNEDGEITTSDIYFQEREKKGHLVYEGSVDPTITGSLGNVFQYKNFKINVFMTYSGGNVLRLDPVFKGTYSDLTAMSKEFKNRWTVQGDEAYTDIPVIADRRLHANDNQLSYAYNAYNYSTARTAKGDFIRLKEISVSYDFPKEWTTYLKMSDFSVKLQATNICLLYSDKKLNGQDPEFYNSGGVASPMPKQFTLTLRMGL